jgi:2OG-Fe(II) oxygenase superfamily
MVISNQDTRVSSLGVFDDPSYAKIAVDNAEAYQNASPFPHMVFDDFLPEALARELSQSFPLPDDSWVERDNQNNRRRFQPDETRMPDTLRHMFRELNSRQFILFLETLTGIDNLLPDPYFIGGGVHLSGTGDFLNVHADFNWHHKLQAHRRVNALFYLSEDWQPEWKGALEFWNKEMTQIVDSALPIFNRLIVFTTSEHSNHGQREPNECPPGVFRKVLNLYYYTTHREDSDALAAPHFTLYKTEASPNSVELGVNYRKSGGAAG